MNLHMSFDPDAPAAVDAGIFGLPYSLEEAKLILIPVPWEATTSYGGGTAAAPQAILQASKQVDLFDLSLGRFYEAGIAMAPIPVEIMAWNTIAKQAATHIIEGTSKNIEADLAIVNSHSEKVNEHVYLQTRHWLAQNKLPCLIGGDHSTPFGMIKAMVETYPHMGILHIDAHADLREAYEGFAHSHASIMYNVLMQTPLKKLVQVGIRDFCEAEYRFMQKHSQRITTFFDADLFAKKSCGTNWSDLCDEIIGQLPQEVYISFDIDGLDPRLCPHTGTPVPGGLNFQEVIFLISKITQTGRRIIAFDLNEVSPAAIHAPQNAASEWDANVGARLLYKLCGFTLKGNSSCSSS